MTNKPPSLDPYERVFTPADVFRLWKRKKKQICKIALFGAACIFLLWGIRQPKYNIEAAFKEGVEKSEGGGGNLRELLGGFEAGSHQPQASALMKSYQVLKPLVSKMGLQASVRENKWLISKILQRFNENIKAELKLPLKDLDIFQFRDVVYQGEQIKNHTLRFSDPEHFSLYLPGEKKAIATGAIGNPVSLPELQFTLVKVPQSLTIGKNYNFRLDSWVLTAKKLRDQLRIASHKANKSIYDIQILHRDRHLGAEILNELMQQYRAYLKREHDQLAVEQLGYLGQRQQQLQDQLVSVLNDHTEYLRKNLKEEGFVDLNSQSNGIFGIYQEWMRKCMAIDLELDNLNEIIKGNDTSGSLEISGFPSTFLLEIQDLKQQRDILEMALQKHKPFEEEEDRLRVQRNELREIRTKKEEMQKLLDAVDQGTNIPIESFDVNRTLALWAQRIHDFQEPEEREDLAEYLEKNARLFSLQEKMLQERIFYPNSTPKELEGIDLTTSRKLFFEYNNKLDAAQASVSHYEQLLKEKENPNFDLGSLSSILIDPLSQEVIKNASDLSLKLKDEKYHSSKEGERWQEETALQKKILFEHLEQLLKIEELNVSLTQEKIHGLQQVTLDCINQKLSVLNEQIFDSVKARRNSVIQEKKLLGIKMEEIRDISSEFPSKWQKEKWLEMKMGMMTKMMEAVTGVVESKTIGHHLHHVESKPLDFAIIPLLPNHPGLFAISFLGAFIASFGFFFLSLIRAILKGFPSSSDKLRAMGFPLLGEISPFCDGPSVDPLTGSDLETLRQISLFLEKPPFGKVVGLIGGSGPDYSYALAENLARMSQKSIVLRCDFKSKYRKEDAPGLIQMWNGEAPSIRKMKGFDYISAGGYTPFGTEMLQSRSFQKFLEELKHSYDKIFLLLRSPIGSAEPLSSLSLCEKAIVTVSGEQTELLTPFIDWAYHDNQCRLTFLATEF